MHQDMKRLRSVLWTFCFLWLPTVCLFFSQKNSANGKRKASLGNQDYASPKQRKLNAQNNTKNEDQAASKFPSKPKPSPKKGQEEHKGHDRPFIKTSSLFRNNPEIPDVLRSV